MTINKISGIFHGERNRFDFVPLSEFLGLISIVSLRFRFILLFVVVVPRSHRACRVSLHCMCQHLHITLFSLILSFHLSLIPLNRFHLGDVNFCLEQIQMPIRHTYCNAKFFDVSSIEFMRVRTCTSAITYRNNIDGSLRQQKQ